MSGQPICYLASEYPAVSHTFILREIITLREQGIPIITSSIKQAQLPEALDSCAKAEMARTFYIKKRLLSHGVASALRCFMRSPSGCCRALYHSLRLAGPKGLAYYLEAMILLSWMQLKNSKHIHVHFANAAASVANIAASTGLCSYSMSVHGPDIFDNVHSLSLPDKLSAATFVRSISHYCSAQMRRWLAPSEWSKLHLVRCGVAAVPVAARGAKNSPPQVLCVGRLCSAKGQHQLLAVSRRLHDAGVDHHLTLVGAGPDSSSLERLADTLQLCKTTTFTGALSQDRVQALYDEADVFVLPSYAEGVPVVLMEAMAKGLPVISTRITGIPELIQHEHSGLLVTPADDDDLFDKLRLLLQDPEKRKRLGSEARDFVGRHFCLQDQTQTLGELFKDQIRNSDA